MNAWAIIAAAGIGKRMGGGRPKQYLEIGGRPIICHTLERFRGARSVENLVVVVEPGREAAFRDEIIGLYGFPKGWIVTGGGAHRQDSVANGLAKVPAACEVVAVHDGVRPFVTPEEIERAIELAFEEGACIVAAPIKETLKRVADDGRISETVDRGMLWGAKTPQCFRRSLLADAMERARRDGFRATDEAGIVERVGAKVKVIEGDERNIKITTPSDILVAEAILKEGEWLKAKG
jgi:2-C-methyl-D-erythritol 4-phosphate cytidylyltransferase